MLYLIVIKITRQQVINEVVIILKYFQSVCRLFLISLVLNRLEIRITAFCSIFSIFNWKFSGLSIPIFCVWIEGWLINFLFFTSERSERNGLLVTIFAINAHLKNDFNEAILLRIVLSEAW